MTPEAMARILAKKLLDHELTELQRMLDEADHALYEAVSGIVMARHPELFVDDETMPGRHKQGKKDGECS